MKTEIIILFTGVLMCIVAFVQSTGENHGIFNVPLSDEYPDLGRKSSRLYGILQAILIIPLLLLTLFTPAGSTILSIVIIIVPLLVSAIYFNRSCAKRDRQINKRDEQELKEQIAREQGYNIRNNHPS